MNPQFSTVERAARLYPEIVNAGYFPIFINWQSSLWSSYFDYLFNVRQGRPLEVKGWWMAAFYLAADLLYSAARAPIVWSFLLWNDYQASPVAPPSDDQILAELVEKDIKSKRSLPASITALISWIIFKKLSRV